MVLRLSWSPLIGDNGWQPSDKSAPLIFDMAEYRMRYKKNFPAGVHFQNSYTYIIMMNYYLEGIACL